MSPNMAMYMGLDDKHAKVVQCQPLWHRNINRITEQSYKSVINGAFETFVSFDSLHLSPF